MVKPWFSEGLRFQCTGCGKCCTGSPGYVFLSRGDLDRFATHFACSPEEFVSQYGKHDGEHIILQDSPGTSSCIFLKDGKCSAYEARPTQCRTFPWWIHNLREPEDWEEAAKSCEGINHVDAPIVSSLEIQSQCLTYLDNLIDQNFSLHEKLPS
jgi:Fe-S-cluster containining protein